MDFLVKLFMAILDKILKGFKLKSEEAEDSGELEDRLKDQIRKDGWD